MFSPGNSPTSLKMVFVYKLKRLGRSMSNGSFNDDNKITSVLLSQSLNITNFVKKKKKKLIARFLQYALTRHKKYNGT